MFEEITKVMFILEPVYCIYDNGAHEADKINETLNSLLL